MSVAIRRRAAFKAACRASDLPAYAADLRMERGRCLAKRCTSRWAVTRISLDFRAEVIDRYATLECALCGRTWRRCAVPAIRSAGGYQAVRLTLLLPTSGMRRWRSRGKWHREGEDAHEIRNADLGDLDEAATAHRKRADRLASGRARVKARKEAAAAVTRAETAAWLDRVHAAEAARIQEEAEARARESRGLA